MSVCIIAEVGVNHNGDFLLAKKLIDMAKDCGADVVKFQTFKAEECASTYAPKAEYQVKDSDESSQFEMIKKLELPFEMFGELKKYADEIGIKFVSTPDGTDSLNCLVEIDVPFIKIGSSEITNHSFLKEIASKNKPILLSTGMSTLEEVKKAVEVIKETGNDMISLMHCTTAYPTEIEDVNLYAMKTLKEEFGYEVGYSDHTLTNEAAISAVALGAKYIEKHITLDKNMSGPDHKASMDKIEFANYVKAIRNTENLLGDGIKKPTKNEKIIMKQVRRSILAKNDIECGTILTTDMLCFKRPGDGIYPEYVDQLVGMKVNRNIYKEEKINWSDVTKS